MYSKTMFQVFISGLLCLMVAACSSTKKDKHHHDQGGTSYGGSVESTAMSDSYSYESVKEMSFDELVQHNLVHFAFDRSEIKPMYQNLLKAHASYLVDNPRKTLVIEGHTDEIGTPEYNIALGERRAKSVERFLLARGVNASQLTTVSYGEERPADPRHNNQEAYAKNRRAVLMYKY